MSGLVGRLKRLYRLPVLYQNVTQLIQILLMVTLEL